MSNMRFTAGTSSVSILYDGPVDAISFSIPLRKIKPGHRLLYCIGSFLQTFSMGINPLNPISSNNWMNSSTLPCRIHEGLRKEASSPVSRNVARF